MEPLQSLLETALHSAPEKVRTLTLNQLWELRNSNDVRIRFLALFILAKALSHSEADRQLLIAKFIDINISDRLNIQWNGLLFDLRHLSVVRSLILNGLLNAEPVSRSRNVPNGIDHPLKIDTVRSGDDLLLKREDMLDYDAKSRTTENSSLTGDLSLLDDDRRAFPLNSQKILLQIADTISKGRGILLVGPQGSGKSFLIKNFVTNYAGLKSPVYLSISEAVDARSLVGNYVCMNPGDFSFELGIISRCILEDRPIVIDAIDKSTSAVQILLATVIETRSVVLPDGRYLTAGDNFYVFATKSLSENEIWNIESLKCKDIWSQVSLPSLTVDQVENILQTKFPRISRFIPQLAALLFSLNGKIRDLSSASYTGLRLIQLKDLIRACKRISSLSDLSDSLEVDEQLLFKIFSDLRDCLFDSISNSGVVRELENLTLGLLTLSSSSTYSNRIIVSKPKFSKDRKSLSVGRADLEVSSRQSQPKLTQISMTTHFCLLLEKCARATQFSENVLLSGESGTGKTTCIQTLADMTGRKLLVLNLSSQTEISELIGGLKPVSRESRLSSVIIEWKWLFRTTYSMKRNDEYVAKIESLFYEKDYRKLLRALTHSVKIVLDRSADRIPEEKNEPDGKRRKLVQTKDWEDLGRKLEQFSIGDREEAFMFDFIEGPLIEAMRTGSWLLIDEINLASNEILDCLLQVLETRMLLITEKGVLEPIKAQEDFVLFAAMNPADDVGKKRLPESIRSQFTEFFVRNIDEFETDLWQIIVERLGNTVSSDSAVVKDISTVYYKFLTAARDGSIVDCAKSKPFYSLRSLTRCLDFAREYALVFGLRGAIYEGLSLNFITCLDRESQQLMNQIITDMFKPPVKQTDFTYSIERSKFCVGKYTFSVGTVPPISRDDYIVTNCILRNLQSLLRAISYGRFPILLQGPTSAGKTSMIEYLANLSGNKFIRINNHEHTDIQEYLGLYVSGESGRFEFREGLLLNAMRKGYWLVLDELNLASSDVLEALNRLLDDNRELYVPEIKETVRPHQNFVLFATQNPVGLYGGRKQLSRAFRNRFVELSFENIPDAELQTIVEKKCQLPLSYVRKVVQVHKTFSVVKTKGSSFDGIKSIATLRDVLRWAKRRASSSDALARNGYILLVSRLRSDDDKTEVQTVIQNIFKNKLDHTFDETFESIPDISVFKEAANQFGIVWTSSFQRAFVATLLSIQNNEPVLLVGETGIGKTSLCFLVAFAMKKKVYAVNAHQNMDSSDLVGSQRPSRDQSHYQAESSPTKKELVLPKFEWVDGPLTAAMKTGSFFLLDEISLSEDSVLERLNSVLESGRTLTLLEKAGNDNVVQAKTGFQFLATMNPSGDFGKRELSTALRNRFTEIWVDNYETKEDYLSITLYLLSESLRYLAPKIVDFIFWYHENVGMALGLKAPSIRKLKTLIQYINDLSEESMNKYMMHGISALYVDDIGAFSPELGSDRRLLQEKIRNCESAVKIIFKTDIMPDLSSNFQISNERLQVGDFNIIRTGDLGTIEATFFQDCATSMENLYRLLRLMSFKRAILLEGNPGVGKTSTVIQLAKLAGKKLSRINLSEQSDLADLIGIESPDASGSQVIAWREAPLLEAMKSGDWILLDEINLAPQSVLEGLNSCLDHRKTIFIPELNRTFTCHPEFQIFAAQNPYYQGGSRNGLPKSFIDRFLVLYMADYSPEDLLKITNSRGILVQNDLLQKVIHLVNSLSSAAARRLFKEGNSWDFNLRDIFRFVNILSTDSSSNAVSVAYYLCIRMRFRTEGDKSLADQLFEEAFKQKPNAPFIDYENTISNLRIGSFALSKKQSMRPKICTVNVADLPMLSFLSWAVESNYPSLVVSDNEAHSRRKIEGFASLLGQHTVRISLSDDSDVYDLLGGFEMRNKLSDILNYLDDLLQDKKNKLRKDLNFNAESLSCLEFLESIIRIRNFYDIDTLIKKLKDFRTRFSSISSSAGLEKLQDEIDRIIRIESGFVWRDASLIEAMRRGYWAILEFANLCTSSVLDRLNPLLEENGILEITEKPSDMDRKVFRHPDFRLFIALNPRYGELSRPMRNRCAEIFDYAGSQQLDSKSLTPPLFYSDECQYLQLQSLLSAAFKILKKEFLVPRGFVASTVLGSLEAASYEQISSVNVDGLERIHDEFQVLMYAVGTLSQKFSFQSNAPNFQPSTNYQLLSSYRPLLIADYSVLQALLRDIEITPDSKNVTQLKLFLADLESIISYKSENLNFDSFLRTSRFIRVSLYAVNQWNDHRDDSTELEFVLALIWKGLLPYFPDLMEKDGVNSTSQGLDISSDLLVYFRIWASLNETHSNQICRPDKSLKSVIVNCLKEENVNWSHLLSIVHHLNSTNADEKQFAEIDVDERIIQDFRKAKLGTNNDSQTSTEVASDTTELPFEICTVFKSLEAFQSLNKGFSNKFYPEVPLRRWKYSNLVWQSDLTDFTSIGHSVFNLLGRSHSVLYDNIILNTLRLCSRNPADVTVSKMKASANILNEIEFNTSFDQTSDLLSVFAELFKHLYDTLFTSNLAGNSLHSWFTEAIWIYKGDKPESSGDGALTAGTPIARQALASYEKSLDIGSIKSERIQNLGRAYMTLCAYVLRAVLISNNFDPQNAINVSTEYWKSEQQQISVLNDFKKQPNVLSVLSSIPHQIGYLQSIIDFSGFNQTSVTSTANHLRKRQIEEFTSNIRPLLQQLISKLENIDCLHKVTNISEQFDNFNHLLSKLSARYSEIEDITRPIMSVSALFYLGYSMSIQDIPEDRSLCHFIKAFHNHINLTDRSWPADQLSLTKFLAEGGMSLSEAITVSHHFLLRCSMAHTLTQSHSDSIKGLLDVAYESWEKNEEQLLEKQNNISKEFDYKVLKAASQPEEPEASLSRVTEGKFDLDEIFEFVKCLSAAFQMPNANGSLQVLQYGLKLFCTVCKRIKEVDPYNLDFLDFSRLIKNLRQVSQSETFSSSLYLESPIQKDWTALNEVVDRFFDRINESNDEQSDSRIDMIEEIMQGIRNSSVNTKIADVVSRLAKAQEALWLLSLREKKLLRLENFEVKLDDFLIKAAKFEIESWANVVAMEKQSIERYSSQFWFPLYGLFSSKYSHLANSADRESFIQSAEIFLSHAKVGDIEFRINLVSSFGHILRLRNEMTLSSEIFNICAYKRMFFREIAGNSEAQILKFNKELDMLIKLAKETQKNAVGFSEEFQHNVKQLAKIRKRVREFFDQDINGLVKCSDLTASYGIDHKSLELASPNFARNSQFLSLFKDLEIIKNECAEFSSSSSPKSGPILRSSLLSIYRKLKRLGPEGSGKHDYIHRSISISHSRFDGTVRPSHEQLLLLHHFFGIVNDYCADDFCKGEMQRVMTRLRNVLNQILAFCHNFFEMSTKFTTNFSSISDRESDIADSIFSSSQYQTNYGTFKYSTVQDALRRSISALDLVVIDMNHENISLIQPHREYINDALKHVGRFEIFANKDAAAAFDSINDFSEGLRSRIMSLEEDIDKNKRDVALIVSAKQVYDRLISEIFSKQSENTLFSQTLLPYLEQSASQYHESACRVRKGFLHVLASEGSPTLRKIHDLKELFQSQIKTQNDWKGTVVQNESEQSERSISFEIAKNVIDDAKSQQEKLSSTLSVADKMCLKVCLLSNELCQSILKIFEDAKSAAEECGGAPDEEQNAAPSLTNDNVNASAERDQTLEDLEDIQNDGMEQFNNEEDEDEASPTGEAETISDAEGASKVSSEDESDSGSDDDSFFMGENEENGSEVDGSGSEEMTSEKESEKRTNKQNDSLANPRTPSSEEDSDEEGMISETDDHSTVFEDEKHADENQMSDHNESFETNEEHVIDEMNVTDEEREDEPDTNNEEVTSEKAEPDSEEQYEDDNMDTADEREDELNVSDTSQPDNSARSRDNIHNPQDEDADDDHDQQPVSVSKESENALTMNVDSGSAGMNDAQGDHSVMLASEANMQTFTTEKPAIAADGQTKLEVVDQEMKFSVGSLVPNDVNTSGDAKLGHDVKPADAENEKDALGAAADTISDPKQEESSRPGEQISRDIGNYSVQNAFDDAVNSTRAQALALSEQLKLILEPTKANKLKGDFKTGKRINLRRIIPFVLSNFQKDKIWLRRVKPSKREYRLVLAIDSSESMNKPDIISLLHYSVALMYQSLNYLECGEMGFLGFDDQVKVLHDIDEPFTTQSARFVFENLKFNGSSTNMLHLLSTAFEMLKKSTQRSTLAQIWQIAIIFTDGIFENHTEIRKLTRQMKAERILPFLIIIDSINIGRSTSITDISQVVFEKTDGVAEQMKITKYLNESFPFDYYLIVRDTAMLPDVLSSTLNKWMTEMLQEVS